MASIHTVFLTLSRLSYVLRVSRSVSVAQTVVQRLVRVPEGELGDRYLRDKLPSDGALPGAIRGREAVLSHAADAVRRDGLQDGSARSPGRIVRD